MDIWLLAVILFLTYISGCIGQSMRAIRYKVLTECHSGLRENVDRIMLKGSIDTSDVDFNVWQKYVSLVVTNESTGKILGNICRVKFDACDNQASKMCYCIPANDSQYYMVFNITAKEKYNNNKLMMRWSRKIDHMVLSETWDIPRVYRANTETTTLSVNGENVSMRSSYCIFRPMGNYTLLQHCCTNAPTPCSPRIYFQGRLAIGTPCASLNVSTVIPAIFSFSHSICGEKPTSIYSCSTIRPARVIRREEIKGFSFNSYRNVALFLASAVAIALVVATVHRVDTGMLFSFTNRCKNEAHQ